MSFDNSPKLIIVDAETAFDLATLNDPANSGDYWQAAQAVKTIKQSYGQEVSVIFVVKADDKASPNAVVEAFHAKADALEMYFGTGQEIASEVPKSLSSRNIYASLLKRKGVDGQNALYIGDAPSIDEDVSAANIASICNFSYVHALDLSHEDVFQTIRNFAPKAKL